MRENFKFYGFTKIQKIEKYFCEKFTLYFLNDCNKIAIKLF